MGLAITEFTRAAWTFQNEGCSSLEIYVFCKKDPIDKIRLSSTSKTL
jgi:hypothetical protein